MHPSAITPSADTPAPPRAWPRVALAALATLGMAASLDAPLHPASVAGLLLLLLLGAAPRTPISRQRSLHAVLLVWAASTLLRAAWLDAPASGALSLFAWALVRDLPVVLPALILTYMAGRWPWLGRIGLLVAVVHLLLVVGSCAVVARLDQPMSLALMDDWLGEATVWHSLGSGSGRSAMLLMAGAALLTVLCWQPPRLAVGAQVVVVVCAMLVLPASLAHEAVRRSELLTRYDLMLDVHRASSPVWLAIRDLRLGRGSPAPSWTDHHRGVLNTWRPAADRDAPPREGYATLIGRYHGCNVLLFVMESWRAQALSPYGQQRSDSSPRFAKLTKRGLLFETWMPSGTWTGSALFSIATGLPSDTPQHPLHTRRYRPQRPVELFAPAGYTLRHVCASDGRFDNAAHFFGQQGWQYVQVPTLEPHGVYGTHDERSLPWAVEQAATLPQPWLIWCESTSNHYPFDFPGASASTPLQSGVRYADAALGAAWDTLQANAALAAKTIVIITADTGYPVELDAPPDSGPRSWQPSRHRVPLLVLLPDKACAGQRDGVLGGHADLPYLIADLLGAPPPAQGLGASPLRTVERRWALTADCDDPHGGWLLWQEGAEGLLWLPRQGDVLRVPGASPHAWWVQGAGVCVHTSPARALSDALSALLGSPTLRWR